MIAKNSSTIGTATAVKTTGLEQFNKYGYKLKVHIEQLNGEPAQPAIYLRRLLATQDLEAWKSDPAGFQEWVTKAMASYWLNCVQVSIWTYQQ